MKNKKYLLVFRLLVSILSISVLFLIWEFAARKIDKPAFIPTFSSTADAFFKLIRTAAFWKTVFASLYRIFVGLALGILLGGVLSLVSHRVALLSSFINTVMGIIKATPVASIIIIIWIMVGSVNVPTAIAILMVCPIIWQAMNEGLNSRNNEMEEVAEVFQMSRRKRIRYILIPRIIKHLSPALLTSVGLAWKSGVAAEIISVTKNSIGYYIKTNKDTFDAEYMFAWTGAVVIISLLFELVIKNLTRRIKGNA